MKSIVLSLIALCLSLSLHAAVQVRTPTNNYLGSSGNLGVDMDGDGNDEFNFNLYSGWPEMLTLARLTSGSQFIENSADRVVGFGPGYLIKENIGFYRWDSSAFVRIWDGGSYPVPVGDTTFLGVRFLINGETHFGWISMILENANIFSNLRIIEVAYEDVPGWGIRTGWTTTVAANEPAPVLDPKISLTRGKLGLDFGMSVQGKINLFSPNGQLIQSHAIDGSRAQVPTTGLASGIYLLRFALMTPSGEATLTRKVFLAQ